MKMRLLHLFVLLNITLGLLCACSCLTWAEAPEIPKIIFMSFRDGTSDIYAINPDGSEESNLTRHARSDRDPVWAPNGEKILFSSDRHVGVLDLFLMNADGTNIRKVFKNTAVRRNPTWSPDGRRIAYWREDDQAIYTATINGTEETRLAPTGEDGGYPKWSPNGIEIAYIFSRKPPVGTDEIRIINLQTNTPRTFLPEKPLLMYSMAWSPDGDDIAFSWINLDFWKNPELLLGGFFNKAAIYTAHRNSGDPQKVVGDPELSLRSVTWAPHGDHLVYSKGAQLFKINLNTRTETQLTYEGRNTRPDWFDPAALPVEPYAELLTTLWGKLKQKQ